MNLKNKIPPAGDQAMSDDELDQVLDEAFCKLTTEEEVASKSKTEKNEGESLVDNAESIEAAFQKFMANQLNGEQDGENPFGSIESMMNEEELSKMLESEDMNDFGNLLISQLTSKEIIYEPMKDIHSKYEDKDSAQYKLITEIVEIFELPSYESNKDANQAKVMDLLQKLQDEGPLPKELMGNPSEDECKMM